MSNIQIGLTCIGLLLVLLSLRIPIGVSLGMTAFTGIFALRGMDAAFALMGSTTFQFIAHWSLTAIPMFILMGAIAFHTGLTRTLFDAGKAWLSFFTRRAGDCHQRLQRGLRSCQWLKRGNGWGNVETRSAGDAQGKV